MAPRALVLALPLLALTGCSPDLDPLRPAVAEVPSGIVAVALRASPEPAAPPPRATLTLVAGGDVSFGRWRGQKLLANPDRDDFAPLRPLLADADLRFVNLESIIFDNGPVTVHPDNILVFNAPPAAAPALRRGGVDVVSLANNHAWDHGQRGLFETFERLDAEGITYVGAGRSREEAYAPRIVERGGFRIAFIAVTSIWNQVLHPHPGKEHIADAAQERLVAAVREARALPGVDKVIVSHHGGEEYRRPTSPPIVSLLRAALDAGADAVLGHHPHILQRVALVEGKPLFYSLGNLIFRDTGKGGTWAKFGAVARLELTRDAPTRAWLCPVRLAAGRVIPLAAEPQRQAIEGLFRTYYDRMLTAGARTEPDAAVRLGPLGEDGCGEILAEDERAAAPPPSVAARR
ncbi:MAG: CapA family protein [Polyangiaceae bacterium]